MDALTKPLPEGLLQKYTPGPVHSNPEPRKDTSFSTYGDLDAKHSLIDAQILLIPATEVLLNSKDNESNALYVDLVSSEDFLASHVLRVPGAITSGNNNIRDNRGKAKQFNTINSRSVMVKESFVYSNKGTISCSVWGLAHNVFICRI